MEATKSKVHKPPMEVDRTSPLAKNILLATLLIKFVVPQIPTNDGKTNYVDHVQKHNVYLEGHGVSDEALWSQGTLSGVATY